MEFLRYSRSILFNIIDLFPFQTRSQFEIDLVSVPDAGGYSKTVKKIAIIQSVKRFRIR